MPLDHSALYFLHFLCITLWLSPRTPKMATHKCNFSPNVNLQKDQSSQTRNLYLSCSNSQFLGSRNPELAQVKTLPLIQCISTRILSWFPITFPMWIIDFFIKNHYELIFKHWYLTNHYGYRSYWHTNFYIFRQWEPLQSGSNPSALTLVVFDSLVYVCSDKMSQDYLKNFWPRPLQSNIPPRCLRFFV